MAVVDHIASGLRTLSALTSGSVIPAGDPRYDEARLAWNLAADQRPAAVAFPETEIDVVFAVAFARESGLRVNVQGTGHNATPLGDMSDTLLIRTSRMRGVEIDAGGRRARVQAGAQWQDVVPRASELGLLALHGSSPDVGIVGYSLGGGLGYAARKLGIQANSVTAIELVTAEGDLVRADAQHDADLFWALRGGGGNFGVVTALEFRLYPVESVYAGMMFWPWEDAERVISRWAEWTREAPDEVTSMARILAVPDLPQVPELLRGRNVAIVNAAYLGDEADGARVLAPLRELGPEVDMFGTMPPVGLAGLHGDPEEPMPGMSDTALLDSLPADAVSAFVGAAGPGSGSALMMAELRHLGGAASRTAEGAGALDRIDAGYLLFGAGLAADPAMAAAVKRDAGGLVDAMAPYGRGRNYLNFAEHETDAASFYPAATHTRLRAVKAAVDPGNVFRANHEL
jgi:FAD/FMN-containing dehydrogenase